MSGLVGHFCEWGQKCSTEDDPNPCQQRAVGVVAVKDRAGVLSIKVCMVHRTALIAETGEA